MAVFNPACDDGNTNRTLAQLRLDLLIRLGYAAQAANPPPGMNDLLNSFINGAHRMIYRSYKALRTERFFTWTMVAGERFYGIRGNDEATVEPIECSSLLDPYGVTWVGLEDLNGVWYPLIEGINPQVYTRADLTPGWPQYYEIRSFVEVFPEPQAAYKLRVKGHFGPGTLTADGDKPVVDDEAVLLLAIAQAKSHYSQPDASQYYQQSFNHIASLVAGSHGTARYIPGANEPPLRTPPVFLPVV